MNAKHLSINWQALTSTISTTMVLILLGLVVLFVLTARNLSNSVRENLTVTVQLQDDIPTAEAKQLQEELKTEPFAHSINYISSEQALQEQIESMGIDPTDFLGSNPFAISMELTLQSKYACTDSLTWITKQLKADPRIAEVMYHRDLVDSLNDNLHKLSIVLLIIAGLLIVVSFGLINNTVRLSVYSQRFIIHTMKLVGANWSFIRRPFLIRSFWIGVISAALADGALAGGIHWLFQYDETMRQYIPNETILIMAGSVLLFGLIITQVCTFVSVTHYLRKRESKIYD